MSSTVSTSPNRRRSSRRSRPTIRRATSSNCPRRSPTIKIRAAALSNLLIAVALSACSREGAAPALPPQVSSFAASVSYKTIYSFGQNGKAGDGLTPLADLIAVGSKLYGTTQFGGTTNGQCYIGCGTVFKVSAQGEESVVYRFKGGSDGFSPSGGLIDVNGELFGTTSTGANGRDCSYGCGTVFKVTTDGKSKKLLYTFAGGTDGADPVAGLIVVGGSLYGTTEYGGITTKLCSDGCGTIFKLTTSGRESIVYRFKGGKDGAQPVSRLIALDGTLYGTTEFGGERTPFCAKGCGTLFRVSTRGSEKIVHSFKYGPDSNDGAFPMAGLTAVGGDLYGTTLGGGEVSDGTVFKANASSGAETVLHNFSCCHIKRDGRFPVARLTRVSGLLYGTTRDGGAGNAGTIFKIAPSGSESILRSFKGRPDGAQPHGSLFLMNGTLYGTTASGGSTSEGTVFAQTP
ncbi:MAG: choice-of-anchor tandem repeat GloVer-containing protein [Candidatus Cybelea sp.]